MCYVCFPSLPNKLPQIKGLKQQQDSFFLGCVNMLCRYICMCGYKHKCVQRLEVSLEYQVLGALPSLFSEVGSFIDLELAIQARLVGHCASTNCLSVSPGTEYADMCRHTWLCSHSFWGWNPSSQAYKANDFRDWALFPLFLYGFWRKTGQVILTQGLLRWGQDANWSYSHLKTWLRLEDLLPK